MKIGIFYPTENVRSGGVPTYLTKYLVPLLSEDNELYNIMYSYLGATIIPQVNQIMIKGHDDFGNHVVELNQLDIIHVVDCFPYHKKKDPIVLDMFRDFAQINVPIVTTVHMVNPMCDRKRPIEEIKYSFMNHPNTSHIITFRKNYQDTLLGRYLNKYEPLYGDVLKFKDRDHFSVHSPYIGYINPAYSVLWRDKPNNIGYIGRTSGIKRGYVSLNSVENMDIFDGFYLATNYDTCGFFDKMNLKEQVTHAEEVLGNKFHLIRSFTPDDVQGICNNLRYVVYPADLQDMEFPNEWLYQETALCGVIPIVNKVFNRNLPDELEELRKFQHEPTRGSVNYNNFKVSDNYGEKVSRVIQDYAIKHFMNKDKAKSDILNSYKLCIESYMSGE